VAVALATQVVPRQPVQLVVDQRHQVVEGGRIAAIPPVEKLRDVAHLPERRIIAHEVDRSCPDLRQI
jgi:hypothetical protein